MFKHKLEVTPCYTKSITMFVCKYCGFEITIPTDILYRVLVYGDKRIAQDYSEVDVLTRTRVRICVEPDKRRMDETRLGNS